MIVLASGNEGVVLQYIDQVDHAISISNLCVSLIYYFLNVVIYYITYEIMYILCRIMQWIIKEKYSMKKM